jgi:hypothetical protein
VGLLDAWLTTPCATHIYDKDGSMFSSSQEVKDALAFLAPRLNRTSALQRMVDDGTVVEVGQHITVARDG